MQSGSEAPFVREQIFPLPCFPSYLEANCEVLSGPIVSTVKMVPSSPNPPPLKKTMATALVENTKRQSVALARKEIVKLAQRFFHFISHPLQQL